MIAEIGSNHNQDLAIAKQLIDVAADAGADAVKFQTYSGSRIYSRKAESKYLSQWTTMTPAELLEDISLPREWHAELADHARSRGDRLLLGTVRPRRGDAAGRGGRRRCSRSPPARSSTCR